MSADALVPAKEHAARLARVHAKMRARDTAALIVDECEMLHCFTGYGVAFSETVLGPERLTRFGRTLFVR